MRSGFKFILPYVNSQQDLKIEMVMEVSEWHSSCDVKNFKECEEGEGGWAGEGQKSGARLHFPSCLRMDLVFVAANTKLTGKPDSGDFLLSAFYLTVRALRPSIYTTTSSLCKIQGPAQQMHCPLSHCLLGSSSSILQYWTKMSIEDLALGRKQEELRCICCRMTCHWEACV